MCSLFTITQGKKDHTSLATSTFGTHDFLTGHELGQHCFGLLVPSVAHLTQFTQNTSMSWTDLWILEWEHAHSKPKGGGRHGTERLCVAHSPGLPGLRLSVSWWAHHLLLWVAPPQAPWSSGLTGSDRAASVWLSSLILCLRTWHNRSCDLQQGTRKWKDHCVQITNTLACIQIIAPALLSALGYGFNKYTVNRVHVHELSLYIPAQLNRQMSTVVLMPSTIQALITTQGKQIAVDEHHWISQVFCRINI